MQELSNELLAFLTSHVVAAASATFALIGAALLPYVREQIRDFIKWMLTPLLRAMPWNQRGPARPAGSTNSHNLVSEFSLVDVLLLDADGRIAFYEKLTCYSANEEELTHYREGVSADGYITDFSTMRGTIIETKKEHGFHISHIDLGTTIHRRSRFTNVYTAKLRDCFIREEESSTQEIAFPTAHLTVQIRFPETRPPSRVRIFVVEGTTDKEITTTAAITELFGQPAIVWQLENPRLKDIYKITWHW
jgi:hypothetical protein